MISDTHKHNKRYWCNQCLNISYETKEKLDDHLKLCMNHEAVRAILAEKDKIDNYFVYANKRRLSACVDLALPNY